MGHAGLPHKYGRAFLKANKEVPIYKCFDPDCHHYYFDFELVVGKRSRCWRCSGNFIMGYKHRKVKKPHCGCTNRAKVEVVKTAETSDDIMKRLGIIGEEDGE